ncbi:hypothetical protein F0562_004239 [Nyssa sinensis]|uniref:Ubiquitin-like domain-containing protein n=1 Tax=Nyssa sinensis TaxID=561372 RepID=A0A5J5C0V7_9ASTE|nr:hypothetical protein F0562_004239 [Nyssa sinensis]
MKIFVKTLKGNHFEIEVKLEDTVADVKKNIETVHGPDVYPAAQQMLIHQGKVLKDATTLEENKVAENSFIVIMLTKNKVTPSGSSTTSAVPSTQAQPASSSPPSTQPLTASQPPASTIGLPQSAPESIPAPAPAPSPSPAPASWRLLASFCQWGIPQQAEVAPVAQAPTSGQAVTPPAQAPQPAVPSSGPNANPLDLFPQGLPSVGSNAGTGTLDFLRNSQQFRALQAMVHANPQILQPMLQELGKQNPHLMRLIQEHQADFLRLINEPVEGEGDILGQLAGAMPQWQLVGASSSSSSSSGVVFVSEQQQEAEEQTWKHHHVRCSHARSDVLQLLNLGQQERALLRVEHVIKDQNMLDVFVMIENYCCLLIDMDMLIQNRECPDELKEAISSLIFASSRCSEFPELQQIREIFTTKFGKAFAAHAVELRNNCGVNPKMIQKLSMRQASLESRLQVLKQIASDNGINLHLEDDPFVIPEDKQDVNQKKQHVEPNEAANLDHPELAVDFQHLAHEPTWDEEFSESVKKGKKEVQRCSCCSSRRF